LVLLSDLHGTLNVRFRTFGTEQALLRGRFAFLHHFLQMCDSASKMRNGLFSEVADSPRRGEIFVENDQISAGTTSERSHVPTMHRVPPRTNRPCPVGGREAAERRAQRQSSGGFAPDGCQLAGRLRWVLAPPEARTRAVGVQRCEAPDMMRLGRMPCGIRGASIPQG
jgi:hypothetical protein